MICKVGLRVICETEVSPLYVMYIPPSSPLKEFEEFINTANNKNMVPLIVGDFIVPNFGRVGRHMILNHRL